MRKYKTKFFVSLSIFFTTAVLAYVGNGCSRSNSGAVRNSSSTSGTNSTPIDEEGFIAGARTVSVAASSQIVDHLSACSGLALPSDKTLAVYALKKGAISTYGSAKSITGPMMMAITSIAGEICNDLILQDISLGARLFTGFALAGNVVPNNSQITDSITKFAVSCWQRNVSDPERLILTDMVQTSVGVNETLAGRKAALLICTAMLSSLNAIKN